MRSWKALVVAVFCFSFFMGCMSGGGNPGRHDDMASMESQEAALTLGRSSTEKIGTGKKVTPVSELKGPKARPERVTRLVIYNARLELVVDRTDYSLKAIRKNAESLGGYMQEMGRDFITVKVPAEKFRSFIDGVEKLGVLVDKEIKGTDVTEKMRDIAIRLDNALKVRTRLVALLDKAKSVEDAIKVERELQRVTETIELLKGRKKFLEHGVAFSTVKVKVNSPTPRTALESEIPFPWVLELAQAFITGNTRERRQWGKKCGVWFVIPDDYIKYHEINYVTRAMSANNIYLRLARHENYKGGSLEFWAKLAKRALHKRGAIAIKTTETIEIAGKHKAILIIGQKEIGGKPHCYLAAIAADKYYTYAFEAWGPMEEFEKDLPALKRSIQSMYIRGSGLF